MVYLALDTCVWIKLLGIKLTSDSSELDELQYGSIGERSQILLPKIWSENRADKKSIEHGWL